MDLDDAYIYIIDMYETLKLTQGQGQRSRSYMHSCENNGKCDEMAYKTGTILHVVTKREPFGTPKRNGCAA